MGTATTISVLDQNGSLIGGCVCPGVKISLEALTSRTALLPGISLDQPKKAIGRNTIDCMRSGIMLGTASMLDGMIARMGQSWESKPPSYSQVALESLSSPVQYPNDL